MARINMNLSCSKEEVENLVYFLDMAKHEAGGDLAKLLDEAVVILEEVAENIEG